MWLIKVFLIFLLQAKYCQSSSIDCCPENSQWVNGTECTNGTRVRLQCSQMYKMDPAIDPIADNFTINEKSLSVPGSVDLINEDQFCLATNNSDQGTPVVLVCFSEYLPWRIVLFGTLCFLSALFLAITLIIYAILPELRDLNGRILIGAMVPLLCAYVMLGIVQLNPYSITAIDDICKTLAFGMYYCFMAAFFWLNFVALNTLLSVWFTKSVLGPRTLYLIFSLIGWGTPTLLLIIAIIGYHTDGQILNPGFATDRCWFEGSKETWVYLYGPVACLTTLNVVYFSLTGYKLWHQCKCYSGSKLRVLRFKCLLYLKLVCVMGITWIFEVISFATGPTWSHYWLITDALNSLQGIIIFIQLVATRKRVRKLLAKKKPFGFNFPKEWAAGDDEEESELVYRDEDVELSQAGAT